MVGESVAVVTGGSSGLGASIAGDLAARGYRVVVADLREPPAGATGPAFYLPTDVTDPRGVRETMDAVVAAHGRIDVLVNSAGVFFRKPFLDIDAEEWDHVCAVNLRGPFLCCQAVAPLMKERGGGAIVNIGSQAGLSYTRGQGAHYHAAKAGLAHLTRVLAFELGPFDVRINCVAPGAMARPGQAPPPPGQRAISSRFREQTPLDRFATPGEVLEAVAFFASPAASGITGQTLLVNGGALGYL